MSTLSAGASYMFTPHLCATFAYSYELGRNLLDGLAVKQYAAYRAFDRQQVSVSCQYKF
jgi:opacity protein-like surface antigen